MALPLTTIAYYAGGAMTNRTISSQAALRAQIYAYAQELE
ncbi:uncharacterized protein METZ01_LOCUS445413, partial [marine metagenome]